MRLALVDGELAVDREARLPGRGAWVHPHPACVAEAARRGAFERAFRRPVTTPAEKLDLVGE